MYVSVPQQSIKTTYSILQPINIKSTQNVVKVCEETEKCFQCDDECH